MVKKQIVKNALLISICIGAFIFSNVKPGLTNGFGNGNGNNGGNGFRNAWAWRNRTFLGYSAFDGGNYIANSNTIIYNFTNSNNNQIYTAINNPNIISDNDINQFSAQSYRKNSPLSTNWFTCTGMPACSDLAYDTYPNDNSTSSFELYNNINDEPYFPYNPYIINTSDYRINAGFYNNFDPGEFFYTE